MPKQKDQSVEFFNFMNLFLLFIEIDTLLEWKEEGLIDGNGICSLVIAHQISKRTHPLKRKAVGADNLCL